MDGFDRELLRRLPLGQAVLTLLGWSLDEAWLEQLYEQHRGRTFVRQFTLPQILSLTRDALLEHDGSARQACAHARQQGQMPASASCFYGKLGRLPLGLSQALLSGATARLLQALPPPAEAGQDPPAATVLPASLAGLAIVVLDGKTIKHVTRRLKILRPQAGALVGGKMVVALALRQGLATALQADPDGHRNDVPLVPGLVAQVRQQQTGPILWVGDRQYCDLKLPHLLGQGHDHFLLRCPQSLRFEADPQRPAQEGTDDQGRHWRQDWGWLGGAAHPRRRSVRRLRLALEEDQELILVTDLLDAQAYPAVDLLAVYQARWGIERLFQQVTEVFHLRQLIGSTPQATLFQASFCLLLYNLIQVVRAWVALDGQQQVQEVSGEQVFRDVQRDLIAWAQAGSVPLTSELLRARRPATPAALQAHLRQLLRGVWTNRWRKTPSTPHPQRRLTQPPPPCGRTSVWRALQEARTQPVRRC